jgi:hypothetical protein
MLANHYTTDAVRTAKYISVSSRHENAVSDEESKYLHKLYLAKNPHN